MKFSQILCFAAIIGLSYGHVQRTRREDAGMINPILGDIEYPSESNRNMYMLHNSDGTAIKGMYEIKKYELSPRTESGQCQVAQNSVNGSDFYDFNCGCNQQLGKERPIGNLVLNHTDCKSGLWIIWSELEASLKPKSITFAGVILTLTNQTVDEVSTSHIKKLKFDNSTFLDLTKDSFKGLNALEELRFLHCIIPNIYEHAVYNHDKLNIIEIVDSNIGIIHENSFLNLPAIEDFVISFSSLGEIKGLGIHLNTDKSTPCSRSGRSRKLNETLNLLEICMDSVIGRQALGEHDHTDSMHSFDTVMGRQIQGAGDLNLPEFGNRFLLYQNQIQAIRSKAVNSNSFGFLILGGNNIKTIESEAFNMQLHNPCAISAALISTNNITNLSERAFASISNKENGNSTTYFSLNKNKFDKVQAQSFQIESGIKIFSVDENIFTCDCMKLSEFLTDQQSLSSVQAELKMKIISKGNCTTGVGLTKFKYSCEEFSTLTPDSTITPEHHKHLTPTPQPASGTLSTASHSNLAYVVVTGAIMILINKIVP